MKVMGHHGACQNIGIQLLVAKSGDGVREAFDIDTEDDESDVDETESEETEDEEDQMHRWSDFQLELLQSALASYRFLPRTTTEKVFTELREDSNCTRGMARNWFNTQEKVATCARDRWEARLKKLAVCDHAEGSQVKVDRKVKFFETVEERS